MADEPITWDTIRTEREATLRRREVVIEAMRTAGHDPEYDVAMRMVRCWRMRRTGDECVRCSAEVDPDMLADVAFPDAMLDRIRGMACRIGPPRDLAVPTSIDEAAGMVTFTTPLPDMCGCGHPLRDHVAWNRSPPDGWTMFKCARCECER
mgnify:CR=1 FL=1